MFSTNDNLTIISAEDALVGRDQKMSVTDQHFVNGHRLTEPFSENLSKAIFGMGCFWGAEKKFWQLPGVYTTAVGYAAGTTKNPAYQEVCSGMTGHNEVVLVVFDEAVCQYELLLKVFFESHNPTQGMRQGNDSGTQYRSGIYTFTNKQRQQAESIKAEFQLLLDANNMSSITTEILPAEVFYYAEEYHQQYLAKNPQGYCGLGGTGVVFESL